MIAHPRQAVLPTLIGLTLSVVFSLAFHYMSYRPPIISLTTTIISPVVPLGGFVRFLVQNIKQSGQTCAGIVTKQLYFQSEYDGRLIPEFKKAGDPADIFMPGQAERINDFNLPDNMWPGHWCFIAERIDNCGFFWPAQSYRTPILCFDVVAPDGPGSDVTMKGQTP